MLFNAKSIDGRQSFIDSRKPEFAVVKCKADRGIGQDRVYKCK